MEAKLAAYRQKKEKEKLEKKSLLNILKCFLLNSWKSSNKSDSQPAKDEQDNDNVGCTEDKPLSAVRRNLKAQAQELQELNERHSLHTEEKKLYLQSRTTIWVLRILKFLLWLCLWGLFIELQFGAVFFAISLLIFAYLNTRTGPKDNKPSAYSVFNKDCERIGGTMTAEQLQSQVFGMPGLTS